MMKAGTLQNYRALKQPRFNQYDARARDSPSRFEPPHWRKPTAGVPAPRDSSAFNDLWYSAGGENCSPCRRYAFTSDRNSQQRIFRHLYRRHRLGGAQWNWISFGNPIWGDFDHDGNLDLFVDNHYQEPPYLYRNNGDGTFTDIRPTSGLRPTGDRHGSAWADFDNDGDLDLFITKGARRGQTLGSKKDQFYENLGGGQFRDIAEAAGVTNTFRKRQKRRLGRL